MSAWQASSPHHGPGRDNKVGREETIGMLAAVEAWVKRDHEAEWKTWLSWLDTIAKRVSTIDGVKTAVREPTGLSNHSPSLTISWDPAKLHITGEEVAEELASDQAADRARRAVAAAVAAARRGRSRRRLSISDHRVDDAARRRQGRGGPAFTRVLSQKRSPQIDRHAAARQPTSAAAGTSTSSSSAARASTRCSSSRTATGFGLAQRRLFGAGRVRHDRRGPGQAAEPDCACPATPWASSSPARFRATRFRARSTWANTSTRSSRRSDTLIRPKGADRRSEGAAAGHLSGCFVRGMK